MSIENNEKIIAKLQNWNVNTKEAIERFADDSELYVECLQEFVNDDSFKKLYECVKSGDYDNAFEYAHALKGVSGNLSLRPMYEIVSVIVDKLRKNNYKGLEKDIDYLTEVKQKFDEIIG